MPRSRGCGAALLLCSLCAVGLPEAFVDLARSAQPKGNTRKDQPRLSRRPDEEVFAKPQQAASETTLGRPLHLAAVMLLAGCLLASSATADVGAAITQSPATSSQTASAFPDWRALLKPEWRAALRTDEKAAWRRVPRAVLKRLRGVAADLADLQQDVYDEDWQNVAIYPNLLQAYLPVFTRYTDSAFPSDSPVDQSLRFSLRYEVGAFYRHVRELEEAIAEKNLSRAEEASALMSLSYDRYLKAGDLYEGYEGDKSAAIVSLDKIEYEPPELEPPLVRDEVVILLGPDKGKTGRVLWVARIDGKPKFAIVRLTYNRELQDAEVKTFNYSWIARTSSSSDQLVKDIGCGFVASLIACTIVYPIDSTKVRLQTGRTALPSPEEGGPLALFDGLLLNLGREAPNASILLGTFNFLKRAIFNLLLQLLNGTLANSTALRFAAMVPAGAVADALGSTVRVPFELMNKQVQAGYAKGFEEAFGIVFSRPGAARYYLASWTAILVRDVPYGTLQLVFFEFFKEFTPEYLEPLGFNLFAQRLVWGFLAGACAGLLTVPVDNISTVVMTEIQDQSEKEESVIDLVKGAAMNIWTSKGLDGFLVGGAERALYYAPQACLFFTLYDTFINLV